MAFQDCSGLTCVSIGNGVVAIGNGAFLGCFKLKEVHITDVDAWNKVDFGGYSANPLNYGGAKLYLNGVEVSE